MQETQNKHKGGHQETEDYREVCFTLELFSVIMAFDSQDTNTIVTLHSSGGKRALKILHTEGLLIQTGRRVIWGQKRKNTLFVESRVKVKKTRIMSNDTFTQIYCNVVLID